MNHLQNSCLCILAATSLILSCTCHMQTKINETQHEWNVMLADQIDKLQQRAMFTKVRIEVLEKGIAKLEER